MYDPLHWARFTMALYTNQNSPRNIYTSSPGCSHNSGMDVDGYDYSSSAFRSWVNTSSAYYPPRPSASRSSEREDPSFSKFMKYGKETGISENPYTLYALLGTAVLLENHREAYLVIKQWLVDTAQIPAERILIDCGIAGISDVKKPDLQIINIDKKYVLVQIEVDSGKMENTSSR